MAGNILSSPTFALQPSSKQVALSTNYITDFNFLNQYLPDTYEKEFERYGNRSVASFLRMVSAEMPSASDQIRWSEQGRLHTKYTNVAVAQAVAGPTGQDTMVFTVNDSYINANPVVPISIRPGQTVMLTPNAIADGQSATSNKGIVTNVNTANRTFTVAFYDANGIVVTSAAQTYTVFIYGSEFKKGSNGMTGSLEADFQTFTNSPIILKDKYSISGSDMAQIGWVEVTTENGASGYLWYLKSQHETRLRFEDYLETAMLEAVPAETGSGVASAVNNPNFGNKGTKGVFYEVNDRGNVWGGIPNSLSDFDTIVSRLDAQGAIEENVLFVNREMSFDIDDFLAALNGLPSTGTAGAASFGLFDNDTDMALNLGFSGFRRGYDFYKTDWKYLNDPTMRGGLTSNNKNVINGLLVPAGSTTVYDQVLGKNLKRPFLHVRYRASETEDRKYKTWITGSAGGAATSDLDAMEVNFLSERCICVLGANNFMLFRYN